MINLSVLGATGSIGRQALEVAQRLPQQISITALAGGSNWQLLAEQARQFRPQLVAVADPAAYAPLRAELAALPIHVVAGAEGLAEVASLPAADTLLAAMSGINGLPPLMAAISANKNIALANKEALVAAGSLVMAEVQSRGLRLNPVDSEHSAIWQCLAGEDEQAIDRLILTASGGAFRDYTAAQLAQATPEQALAHPNWRMGAKITVDCATMVNKGLEVIEAHWLFGLPFKQIEVVVHPQSIVHSLVAFVDGSIKAQLGFPDMRLPIQYALLNRQRPPTAEQRLNLTSIGRLDFYPPDGERFPALDIIRAAGEQGGTAPAYISAVNEELVGLFLNHRLTYADFIAILRRAQADYRPQAVATLADVLQADAQGREDALMLIPHS